MSNKQLLISALKNKETERPAWVPFVGCHAAKLIGVDAEVYFKTKEHIVNGVVEAYKQYRPDGLPILFDLQIEAEALGCKLKYSHDNPPSVATHPLDPFDSVNGGKALSDLRIPTIDDGRYRIVMEAAKEICDKIGDKIALYGLITGPFTLALHLLGTEIFFQMEDEPELVHELMKFCENVCIETAKMYIQAGTDVIAVVDPMTSQISPVHFAEFVSPYVTRIFEYVGKQGKLSSFFVCGDAKRNIEEMCKCKPDNVSIDENIPLDYVRDVCKKYDISFGGNIKLTVTMLFGSPTDNINDAQNCMTIGGTKGYVLSPGCDMPFATPIENVLAVSSLVHGEISEFLSSESVLDGIEYNLPDYKTEKKVIIDVITLDSASCAPCQYMMEAVKNAVSLGNFGEKVEYIEHKVKEKQAVVCMIKLGVSNIPTIVIDGEIKYVSIIPETSKLKDDIAAALKAKNLL